MEFKLSRLFYGFCYWKKEHNEITLYCFYDAQCGDLDVFAVRDLSVPPYEHLFHDSVGIHEDDLEEYLDDLIEKLSNTRTVIHQESSWICEQMEKDNTELLSE